MSDSEFHPIEIASAVERTRELRSSDKGRWKSVRDRLATEGIDPGDAAVGGLFPEDAEMESGVLVTRAGRFFEFDFEWAVDEEGNDLHSYDEAWVCIWKEMDAAEEGAFAKMQDLGRSILESE